MKCLLPSITHPRTHRELEKDIIFMEHFDDVSPDFIRKLAKKLKCPPKSSQHISDINRMKALVTRRTVWKGKAQPRPEEVMPWLRTFRIREIRYIKLHEPDEIKSWRASLSNFNRLEGFEKRIYFTSEVDRKILIMKIQANLYRAMQ